MYKVDNEGVCLLGIPNANNDSRSELHCSKIGGHAIWHDSKLAPRREDDIKCSNCTESTHMMLFMQIFAPTDIDRSLYVYVCANSNCSLTNKGWIIIRNQRNKDDEVSTEGNSRQVSLKIGTEQRVEAVERKEGVAIVSAKSIDNAPKISNDKKSEWDFLMNNGSSSRAVGRRWNDLDTKPGNSEMESLIKLLEQRDISLAKNDRSVSIADANLLPPCNIINCDINPGGEGSESGNDQVTLDHSCGTDNLNNSHHCLKAILLKEIEEDWGFQQDEAAWIEGIEFKDRQDHTATSDERHVSDLLKNYLAEEEDAEVVEALNNLIVASNIEEGWTDTGENRIESGYLIADTRQRRKSDEITEEALTSKIGCSSTAARYERYFQIRVKSYPNQVLRYAYGGQPLWCTHPAPNISHVQSSVVSDVGIHRNSSCINVPFCEYCGAQRVFECQIMPAALRFMSPITTMDKKKGISNALDVSINSTFLEKQQAYRKITEEDIIDFGVVAIYSCPNSCDISKSNVDDSQTFAKEVAVVQSPPDISNVYAN